MMATTDGGRPVDVTIGSLLSSTYTPGGRYRVKSGITSSQRWNPEHQLHPPWVYIAQHELHPSRLRPGYIRKLAGLFDALSAETSHRIVRSRAPAYRAGGFLGEGVQRRTHTSQAS